MNPIAQLLLAASLAQPLKTPFDDPQTEPTPDPPPAQPRPVPPPPRVEPSPAAAEPSPRGERLGRKLIIPGALLTAVGGATLAFGGGGLLLHQQTLIHRAETDSQDRGTLAPQYQEIEDNERATEIVLLVGGSILLVGVPLLIAGLTVRHKARRSRPTAHWQGARLRFLEH